MDLEEELQKNPPESNPLPARICQLCLLGRDEKNDAFLKELKSQILIHKLKPTKTMQKHNITNVTCVDIYEHFLKHDLTTKHLSTDNGKHCNFCELSNHIASENAEWAKYRRLIKQEREEGISTISKMRKADGIYRHFILHDTNKKYSMFHD